MDIKKVFVVGAGFMGSGIVENVAVKGLAVTAYDISQNQLDKSIAGIRKNLEKSVSKGKLSEDEKEAASWFKKAAELGEPDSMFHLAWMYQEGLGVEKNQDLATDYLYQSAEAGWEPAIKAIKGEE